MRKIYTFVIALLLVAHGMAQTKNVQSGNEFIDFPFAQYPMVSPGGEYIVMFSLMDDVYSLWNYQTKASTDLGKCEASGVSDHGDVAGLFDDPSYMYGGSPLSLASINRNGQWESLGLGRFSSGQITRSDITDAYCISGDGKAVFGMSYTPQGDYVPFAWKQKDDGITWDTLTYATPDNYSGKILAASADGNVAAGWINKNGRTGIVWTSPTEYKLFNDAEATSVSGNGKYVIIGGNKLYKVDTEELVPITTSKEGRIYGLGVTDNGMVVGYRQIGFGSVSRTGFVWSEIIGYYDLSEFIAKFASDMVIPDYFNFDPNVKPDNEILTGVSADGSTIVGWMLDYNSAVPLSSFVLRFGAPIDMLNRPYSLKAKVSDRNQVALTWNAPEPMTEYTLTGDYKVYRNGEFVATATGTSYLDADVAVGYAKYKVSALYTGDRESGLSEEALAIIVDNYNIPFYDNFDSASLETNFWSTSRNSRFTFYTIIGSDYVVPGYSGRCITYRNYGGNTKEEQKTLTSKLLDASELSTVNASFLLKRSEVSNTDVPDTLFFEVCSNIESDSWKIVDRIALDTKDKDWAVKSYDISSYVAGNLFKFRFRGSDVLAGVTVDIDNVAISNGTAGLEVPKGLTATKTENSIDLRWQDPSGSHELTYNKENPQYASLSVMSIGNDGTPFIAVNRFEPEDMKAYQGLFLTSVSAYINKRRDVETEVETQLSLAVYIDGKRVVNQEIETHTSNAWNTFKLNTPIAISEDKTLEFGIEVREHDIFERPLTVDKAAGVAGKGDLFTEDTEGLDNIVWDSLAGNKHPYNWSIIGNVREAASEGVERTEGILGYEIYCNDIKINSKLCFPQSFQDTNILNRTEQSYTVIAYYDLSGYSNASESASIGVGIEYNLSDDVYLYLDQISGEFRVKGDFVSAAIFDLNGRKVSSNVSEIHAANLPTGVYVVRIVCADNSVVTKKVILK